MTMHYEVLKLAGQIFEDGDINKQRWGSMWHFGNQINTAGYTGQRDMSANEYTLWCHLYIDWGSGDWHCNATVGALFGE